MIFIGGHLDTFIMCQVRGGGRVETANIPGQFRRVETITIDNWTIHNYPQLDSEMSHSPQLPDGPLQVGNNLPWGHPTPSVLSSLIMVNQDYSCTDNLTPNIIKNRVVVHGRSGYDQITINPNISDYEL